MNLRRISLLLCTTTLVFASAGSDAAVGVIVGAAPPAPVVEPVPAPPAVGYVWRAGYWRWDGVRYAWIPGVYVRAPRLGATWVPGHWIARRRGWVWVGGHWR
jgi:hypothetical protein